MLEVHNLVSGYGELKVLHGISLNINEGEIISILGANGVGKTTLLRTISGLNEALKGKILYFKDDITNWPDFQRVKHGIIHVPQDRGIISDLTVVENLEIGAFLWRKDRDKVKQKIEEVFNLFPRLYERKKHKGGSLSGGEQQMLAISRGLISNPKILMLDEPSLGIAPKITKEIFGIIEGLRKTGISIILVEQNVRMALDASDRTYILSNGKVIAEGRSENIKQDKDIQKMYMGA